MIDTLISSKTRIKLLLKLFLNVETKAYLRGLQVEFGESTNAIRIELNRLEEAKLIVSHVIGNKKMFSANTKHPLFPDIHSILLKYTGLDRIVENVIKRLGSLDLVYLGGDLGRGLDSPVIDLILIGNVDMDYLPSLIRKAERLINKKIKYITFSRRELDLIDISQLTNNNFLLWKNNENS